MLLPPVAPAAVASQSEPAANIPVLPVRVRHDSNEYPPDETSELRQRTKALTSRRDGPLAGLAAPVPAVRPASPRQGVSPASSSVQEAAAKVGVASPISGDPFDPDLFDRMERDAQQQRARQHTVADLPAPTPAEQLVSRQITCPVCGHGFLSTKLENDQQVCPQCHTSFNIAKGHVVSGGPRQASDDPLIGRALRGCLIDRKIGEGGMGSVYHARQLSLDRSVAVKVLPPELARNRNFISRFEREAKSLAKINHPNILHIYDFGEEPQLGVYFMIIEFVEGKDLGEILHEQFSMGQVEVLDIVRQAALGLEMAAQKGVIHRDIKPDNLMLTAEGICKVSDFGLAKGHGAERDVTNVGVRVGTPAFMSPEQCDGIDVDFRSDIYNLGCTAFLALTGSLPFDADTPFAIMLKHKNDPVPKLSSFNPNIHPRVDSLVQRMIAKAPADRFASLRELVELVEELEVEIAGTTNVLRKSRGPFRAMSDLEAVEHARMTSKGQRDDQSVDANGRGTALPAAARPVLPAMPAARAPLPPAPLPTEVPDWLKPVEQPTVKRPASSVTHAQPAPMTPPPVAPGGSGSGLRDLRVKLAEARNRNLQEEAESMAASANRLAASGQHEEAAVIWQRAAALSPNMRESQELQARALRARQYSGRRRTLRTVTLLFAVVVVAGLSAWQGVPVLHNQFAERELAPIESIIVPDARLRELEHFIDAYGQPYTWYSMLFQQPYQVAAVVKARREAESLRRQLNLPSTAIPPRSAQAPTPSRTSSVGVPLATPTAPSPVASQAPVPVAAPIAVPVPRQAPAPMPAPVDPRLTALEKAAKDPGTPWPAVAKQATLLAAQAGPSAERAHEVCAEAQREIQASEKDLAAIRSAWTAGQQGRVQELIAQFRQAHGRSGQELPVMLPGRLEIIDGDCGRKIPDARITTSFATPIASGGFVAGAVQLAAGERRFCRFATSDLTIEIAVPGYRQEVLHLAAIADEQEQHVQVVLHPEVRWQRQIGTSLAWIRLRDIDEHLLLVRHNEGIATLHLSDGTVASTLGRNQLLATPQGDNAPAQFTTVWTPTQQGVIVGTTDGLVMLLGNPGTSGLAVIDTLYRGHGAITAVSEHELTFEAGRHAIFVVEAESSGAKLTARTSEHELWKVTGLVGQLEPQLWFHDDKVVVLDDQRVQAIDETDGHLVSSVVLSAKRSGPGMLIDQGGIIAIPVASGIELMRPAGAAGDRLEIFHDAQLDQADGRQVVAADSQLLVARSDRSMRLLGWKDGHAELVWSQNLPADSAAISFMGLAGEHALIADEQGAIYVYARSTGALQRRFASASPLLGAPLEVHGLLIFADRAGAISAISLPPLPP